MLTPNPNKVGVAVECEVCGRQKSPLGRSALFDLSLCDYDCPGYYQYPKPGSLWPGESEAEFGFLCGNTATRIKEPTDA